MARAHEIGIAADTRDFERGIRDGVIDPLEDAERGLDHLADAADDAGRDGSRGIDRLEDALKDAQQQSEKTERAVEDIGDSGARGFGKLGDAGEEASGELRQNLGETFSSFRGDLEDLPQIAQDVFGGIAGSAGTVTASLGLAGVAGAIGLAIAKFQEMQEQEEARKERISEWVGAYIGGLSTMEDALADFASIEAIYTDPEKYEQAGNNAKNWGVDVSTAVNAMAGDMTALSVVEQRLAEQAEELADVNIRHAAATGEGREQLKQMEIALRDGTTAYEDITGEMSEARKIADQYSDSLLQVVRNSDSATVEVDKLGNTVYTLPDGKQIMIDAETGRATTDLDDFEEDADGVIDRLNKRDINIKVNTALSEAQKEVNRFVDRNNGRSIRLHGRFDVSPAGVDWD